MARLLAVDRQLALTPTFRAATGWNREPFAQIEAGLARREREIMATLYTSVKLVLCELRIVASSIHLPAFFMLVWSTHCLF